MQASKNNVVGEGAFAEASAEAAAEPQPENPTTFTATATAEPDTGLPEVGTEGSTLLENYYEQSTNPRSNPEPVHADRSVREPSVREFAIRAWRQETKRRT